MVDFTGNIKNTVWDRNWTRWYEETYRDLNGRTRNKLVNDLAGELAELFTYQEVNFVRSEGWNWQS
jgi:hypothetical protein